MGPPRNLFRLTCDGVPPSGCLSLDGAVHSAALANGRLASRWPTVKTDMAAIL
jgi:hypothetical protein